MSRILVIDDEILAFEPGLRHALKDHELILVDNGTEGLAQLERHPEIACVLLDIRMPRKLAQINEREGIAVLEQLLKARPGLPVVMLSALNDVELVVEAMRLGAHHYLTKPFDRDRLRDVVESATRSLQEQLERRRIAQDAAFHLAHGAAPAGHEFRGILGASPLMRDLYGKIARLEHFDDLNVVILGETGSGKDMVARAIAEGGARAGKPFVKVDCGALPESLLESTLFGHKKGAFSGAITDHTGLFRKAHGGTLFLDEIGETTPTIQAKLLRAVEYGEIRPVGSDEIFKVDVKVICATNRDLSVAKENGSFRPDLYYRLCDLVLWLPPLRQRKDDIPLLAIRFLEHFAARAEVPCQIEEGALLALMDYDWPGNVRELNSMIKRAVLHARDGHVTEAVIAEVLPPSARPRAAANRPHHQDLLRATAELQEPPSHCPSPEETTTPLQPGHYTPYEHPQIDDINAFKDKWGSERLRDVLERALKEGGNIRAAMDLLGMPESRYDALRKTLQRLDLSIREVRKTPESSS